MLLMHSTMTPLALIALRELMSSELGLTQTGHWQAAWRLSETYLAVVTSSVSMYFLPKLGELASQPAKLRQEVLRTVSAVAIITASIATVLFVGREWVVRWVFAPSFAPMAELMPWQLAGDVLKTVAWSLGFVLVALVRRRWYMTLELIVPVLYVGIAALLLPQVGIIGTVWAYGLSSIVQLVLAAVALRDILLTQREPQDGEPL